MPNMDDTIEICSGCGKMPRPLDSANGYFICSRCGNRATMVVDGKDYEKIVSDLDQKFHAKVQTDRVTSAMDAPVEIRRKPASVSKKKPVKIVKLTKKKSAKAKPAKSKKSGKGSKK